MRRTPLYDTHLSLKARMAPFGGWDMPVQYSSILAEARAVRAALGVFDVSHMGRVSIRGAGAASFLDRLLSFDVPALKVGKARYTVICTAEGGIIDDCIAYRSDEQRFLLIPNASNSPAVLEWLGRWAPNDDEVHIEDRTAETAMLAVQGPAAESILAALTSVDLASLRPFSAVEGPVVGHDATVARTGYTGEDGFEIIVPAVAAREVWDLLLENGASPCGLGARDILRLEAGLLLHGNDMDVATNPYEARLDRFVDPDRAEYVAGAALRQIREQGVSRVLVGFNMVGRGIPRHGHAIREGSRMIGQVTSGGVAPTLGRNIGLGYVPTNFAEVGTRFNIDIRGRFVEAEVTRLPFYRRRRRKK